MSRTVDNYFCDSACCIASSVTYSVIMRWYSLRWFQ